MVRRILAGIVCGCACAAGTYAAVPQIRSQPTVVLIVADGVRWQEVFSGADPTLLNGEAGGSWTPEPELRAKYWRAEPAERRAALFPFLWGTVAREGQLYGNQLRGSKAQVTNPMWFSYPGYNEMSTGVADPHIDRNEYGPNPNVTVFEWLNGQPGLKGQVEIFGTWSVFHDIFNEQRSHLPVHSGATLVPPSDGSARGALFRELYETTTRLEGEDPYDAFLHVALRDHLKGHHPRVLFVGFGDTDNFAHSGHYDLVLEAAHHFDEFVASLWQQMQADPRYRNNTTFIITTDHGRGSGLEQWKEHGKEQPGSENVWIGVLGPHTPALGERHDVATVTQAQIAATVAAAVGHDYARARPDAARPLTDALTR